MNRTLFGISIHAQPEKSRKLHLLTHKTTGDGDGLGAHGYLYKVETMERSQYMSYCGTGVMRKKKMQAGELCVQRAETYSYPVQ